MIINQLPSVSSAADADEIVVEIGTTTYKIKKSDFLKEFMQKSGGEFTGNVTVKGVLDVTPRRCYAALSSAGWYRVMKIVGGAGSWSFSIDFDITRSYNNTNNEVHSVKMLKTHITAPSFVNEASKTNALNVGAIRYTIDSDGVGYVDIRYDANSANTVVVDFTVHTNPTLQPYFTAESLQNVAPSPSGETVLVEYTFVDNRSGEAFYAGSFSGDDDSVIQQACEAIRAHFPNDIGKYSNNPFPVSFFRTQAWEFVGTGWIRASRVYLIVEASYNGELYIVSQESSGATPTIKTFVADTEANGVVTWNTDVVTGDQVRKGWKRIGNICIANIEFTPISGKIATENVICTGLPEPLLGGGINVFGGNSQQFTLQQSGDLTWYFPTDTTTIKRIDETITYFCK